MVERPPWGRSEEGKGGICRVSQGGGPLPTLIFLIIHPAKRMPFSFFISLQPQGAILLAKIKTSTSYPFPVPVTNASLGDP